VSTTTLGIIVLILLVGRLVLGLILHHRGSAKDVATRPSGADGPPVPSVSVQVFFEYLDSFIVAGVTALFLISFVVQSFYIPSGSMEPTLQIRDYILVNKFIFRFREPRRGDIVVFHPPPRASADNKDFIKRVIAVEGDTLAIRDGVVYLNRKPLHEPYLYDRPSNDFGPATVPAGHLFMMGDHRNNSDDSRSWGFLPRRNVVGKAEFIFFPVNRAQILPPRRTAPAGAWGAEPER